MHVCHMTVSNLLWPDPSLRAKVGWLTRLSRVYMVICPSTPCRALVSFPDSFRGTRLVGPSFLRTKPASQLRSYIPSLKLSRRVALERRGPKLLFHVRTIMYLYWYTNFQLTSCHLGQQCSRSNSNLVPVYALSSTKTQMHEMQTQMNERITSPHKWLRHVPKCLIIRQ